MSRKKNAIQQEKPHGNLNKLKFGAKISNLLIERGFTSDSFAAASGISYSTVQQIRSGKRLPSLEKYMWIIETLGVSDILPLSGFVAKENEALVKNDRIIHELYELTKDMSPEQLDKFIDGIKCLKIALVAESKPHNNK